MTNVADRVTRFASDLVDDAAAEGERENRSARQQLEHWARIGREVSSQRAVARRRVEAALRGRTPLAELSPHSKNRWLPATTSPSAPRKGERLCSSMTSDGL